MECECLRGRVLLHWTRGLSIELWLGRDREHTFYWIPNEPSFSDIAWSRSSVSAHRRTSTYTHTLVLLPNQNMIGLSGDDSIVILNCLSSPPGPDVLFVFGHIHFSEVSHRTRSAHPRWSHGSPRALSARYKKDWNQRCSSIKTLGISYRFRFELVLVEFLLLAPRAKRLLGCQLGTSNNNAMLFS